MGFRQRPEAAFESLYSRHVRDVYGYALGVLGSSADAEDVTQTTFLNAYRALQDGQRPRTPRSWLFAIAHNVCRQRFRQAARRPREVELHDGFAVEDETDAPSASDIARALQSLPFTQRSALVMRELEGRSQAEIADALGVSVSAVETLLFRARRGMREQLESTLTCGEAARAISRQLDGASARSERAALRAHLRVCEECATFARRARARSGALRRVGGALPLPASLLSWSIGGGGGGAAAAPAASGLAIKLLAGTAAVALCAGATEQTVVHHRHDPPPRVAAGAPRQEPAPSRAAALNAPARGTTAASPTASAGEEAIERGGARERANARRGATHTHGEGAARSKAHRRSATRSHGERATRGGAFGRAKAGGRGLRHRRATPAGSQHAAAQRIAEPQRTRHRAARSRPPSSSHRAERAKPAASSHRAERSEPAASTHSAALPSPATGGADDAAPRGRGR